MKTVTLDILHEEAIERLEELEEQKLIHVHKEEPEQKNTSVNWKKYKGAMTQQPLAEVDKQLKELRDEWK